MGLLQQVADAPGVRQEIWARADPDVQRAWVALGAHGQAHAIAEGREGECPRHPSSTPDDELARWRRDVGDHEVERQVHPIGQADDRGGLREQLSHGRTRDGSGAADSEETYAARARFIEGWLSASLLFCVGPLTILGSLSDGLGRGIDQLTLKAVLDGFAALAFASSFGVGVLLSAVSVGVVQGSLTALGVVLGSLLPDAHIAALTATGGLLLVGIGFRLLRIREVPVGDMLPALLVAPLLTQLVVVLR